jgi:hypothetical protein
MNLSGFFYGAGLWTCSGPRECFSDPVAGAFGLYRLFPGAFSGEMRAFNAKQEGNGPVPLGRTFREDKIRPQVLRVGEPIYVIFIFISKILIHI